MLVTVLLVMIILPRQVFASNSISQTIQISDAIESTDTSDEQGESNNSNSDDGINSETDLETNGNNIDPISNEIRLKIEDTYIYDGMTKAYKDGYEPEVKDGEAKIVLPIIADDNTDIKEITVTPNLGDAASSPFIYKNYQKTFKATEESVQATNEKKQVFLVSYTFALNNDRMNGTYPVLFDMTARAGNMNITQSFTVYVRITDMFKT